MAMMSKAESMPDQKIRLAGALPVDLACLRVGLKGFALSLPGCMAIPTSRVHSAVLMLEAAHMLLRAAQKRMLEALPNADIIIHPDPRGANTPQGGVFALGPVKGHA
ncbi:cation efflux family protein [Asticcacaulis biprosthecium C19]|uniref:Cation efflux family protein n=1 Tax=Asticcacaulis biprosthecium C19 TaxID=715226 RepID=F4QL15_9CAUL|nr:hypothetical protein [Asticcacaulis biprosthecium]EGF92238.1 cation efflux family protein [Asticcacaulis biprosthecium C19]